MKSSLIFGIFLLMITMGCGSGLRSNYELNEKSFNAKSLKMVEQETGLTLPTGSRGLNMYYKGFQIDPSFIAKIEIPTSEYTNIVNQLDPFPGRGPIEGSLGKKVSWWFPSGSSIRLERRYLHGPDSVYAALCEENGHWILYLEWVSV